MIVAMMLIGVGIICIALGVYFLIVHYRRPSPNDELEWVGYGDHPFRK